MKSIAAILKENFSNKYLIHRMATYELKKKHSSTALGIFWVLLTPLIQIMIYWLVFGIGLRSGRPVDDVPYFLWMIVGIVPWLYTSQALIRGANSIHSYLSTVSRMNFPLSIVPTAVLFSNLYTHFVVLIILLAIVLFNGFITWKVVFLLYFVFALTAILWTSSFVLSTLSTISRDFQLFFQSCIRMLFYLTPILFHTENKLFLFIISFNPFTYVVEGFRMSLLDGDPSMLLSWQTCYFWGIVVLLFVYGSYLHVKFRRYFIDYM
ncbi:MAG: ABC transporter permease [Bacilli bacterium]